MKIHLVRHGKTDANEKGLYCGNTDLPLLESGAIEIAQLKQQGVYPTAEMFFTSGLIRAGQTLTIICGNVRRKAIPDMSEFKFGTFEMKSHFELKDRDDYIAWVTDETGEVHCPDGESKRSFEKRVLKGYRYIVDALRESDKSSALVVCHGGVIIIIMEYLFPDTKNFFEWQPVPGRGYTIEFDTDLPITFCNI